MEKIRLSMDQKAPDKKRGVIFYMSDGSRVLGVIQGTPVEGLIINEVKFGPEQELFPGVEFLLEED